MIERLQDWLDGLAPRERVLVLFAGAFTLLALLWLLLVQPLLLQKARAEDRLREQQQLLAELSQLAARGGPQVRAPAAPGTAGQSLVVLIDRTVRERGLAGFLRRNQPDGQDSIRLRLENVPFDQLVEWLADLQGRYGLAATSVTIDPASERGRVDTNLVLAQSGG